MNESITLYRTNNLPLDSQWADIDIMDNDKTFTVDQKNFGNIKEYVDFLHKRNIKFVPVVESGIAVRPDAGYFPYDEGVDYDVFIKNPNDWQDYLIGMGKAAESVFPDWFAHNTESYWTSLLKMFRMKVPFDGIWLSSNEPSSYCNGPCRLD